MDIAKPIPAEITAVKFSFYSADQVRAISAKQISNPVVLDGLGRPARDGLYDPHLGPMDRDYLYVFG